VIDTGHGRFSELRSGAISKKLCPFAAVCCLLAIPWTEFGARSALGIRHERNVSSYRFHINRHRADVGVRPSAWQVTECVEKENGAARQN
jgi:hypothetical protein